MCIHFCSDLVRQAYCPCLTDEDPEAQGERVTYETHAAGKGRS